MTLKRRAVENEMLFKLLQSFITSRERSDQRKSLGHISKWCIDSGPLDHRGTSVIIYHRHSVWWHFSDAFIIQKKSMNGNHGPPEQRYGGSAWAPTSVLGVKSTTLLLLLLLSLLLLEIGLSAGNQHKDLIVMPITLHGPQALLAAI